MRKYKYNLECVTCESISYMLIKSYKHYRLLWLIDKLNKKVHLYLKTIAMISECAWETIQCMHFCVIWTYKFAILFSESNVHCTEKKKYIHSTVANCNQTYDCWNVTFFHQIRLEKNDAHTTSHDYWEQRKILKIWKKMQKSKHHYLINLLEINRYLICHMGI